MKAGSMKSPSCSWARIFSRVTEKEDGLSVNTYYGWEEIASIRTYSTEPEE